MPIICFGAFEGTSIAPVNIAQGLLMVNFNNSYGSSIPDPASLVFNKKPGLSFLTGKIFNLKQLQRQTVKSAFPLKNGTLGLDISVFGNGKYSESQISLGWGGYIQRRISLGVVIHSYSLSVQKYGNASTLGISLAAHFQLSPELDWGLLLKNLNQPKIGKAGEILPQLIITAIHFSPAPALAAQIEWEQDTMYRGIFKFGFEVKPKPWLFLRGGYVSGQLTAGIGWRLNYVLFDYAFVTHPHLGNTQWIGFGFPLGWN